MKSAAEDIKDILISISSLDLVFGQNLFIGNEPANVTQAVTLFDTPGRGMEMSLNAAQYRYEAVQIRIKGHGYDVQFARANEIMMALHKRRNEVWNGSLYLIIYATNAPALLDWSDSGQVRFIINLQIQRKET